MIMVCLNKLLTAVYLASKWNVYKENILLQKVRNCLNYNTEE